jgi:hypothetical protein
MVEFWSIVLVIDDAGNETVDVAVIEPTTRLPILDVEVTRPPFRSSRVEVELANTPPQVVGVNGKSAPVLASVPQVMLPDVSAFRSQFELLRPATVRPPAVMLRPPAIVDVAVEVEVILPTVKLPTDEVAETVPARNWIIVEVELVI